MQAYPGTSTLRRDIATRSRAYLEGLSRVPGASPEIGLEVARGYIKTGRILGLPDVQGMGDAAAARQDLAKAEVLSRRLLAATPSDALREQTALAQTLSARAAIARTVDNDAARARHLYDEAARLTARKPHDPPAVDQCLTHARALIGVAELLDDGGQPAAMLPTLDEAAADLSVVPAEPDRVSRALTRATMLNLRGDAVYFLGNVAGSLALYRQAAATIEGARDKTPDMRLLERGAFNAWNVASVLDELGRKAEGLAIIDRGVADAELMRMFENSTRAQHVADIVHTQRAQALASLGRFDEAIAQARAELADVRATAAASPDSFEAARAVPVVLRPVGEVYLAAGRRHAHSWRHARSQRIYVARRGRSVAWGCATLAYARADIRRGQGGRNAMPGSSPDTRLGARPRVICRCDSVLLTEKQRANDPRRPFYPRLPVGGRRS